MRKEYGMLKKVKIFNQMMSIIIIMASVIGGINVIFIEKLMTMLPFVIIGFIVGILGLVDAKKSKVIIEDERIILKELFVFKSLKFEDIKGFELNRKAICFFPSKKRRKIICIPKLIENFEEFLKWSNDNFRNLTLEKEREQEKAILDNDKYGKTVGERNDVLKKYRKLVKVINLIFIFICFSLLFIPYYYKLQLIVVILIPVLILIIVKFSKGLIILYNPESKVNPDMSIVLIIPGCVLTLRVTWYPFGGHEEKLYNT